MIDSSPDPTIIMAGDSRPERLSGRSTGDFAGTATRPIVSLLAHAAKSTDLLPLLHQHALDVTGGSCALLFQRNPHTGVLRATSAFRLDSLRTDSWEPEANEAALLATAFERGEPLFVSDVTAQMPDLAESGEMPDRVHDVVRSLALGLVDDQGAVKGSGLRLAGHSQ